MRIKLRIELSKITIYITDVFQFHYLIFFQPFFLSPVRTGPLNAYGPEIVIPIRYKLSLYRLLCNSKRDSVTSLL